MSRKSVFGDARDKQRPAGASFRALAERRPFTRIVSRRLA
jgi:hypothetical protein